MRNFPRFNFDAFDNAQGALESLGYDVISPAQMDREVGFDPETMEPDREFLEAAMRRDIEAILRSDLIVLLPGWEHSIGATAERHLAKWRHIPAHIWPSMAELS